MKYLTGLVILLMVAAFVGCSTPKAVSPVAGTAPQRQEVLLTRAIREKKGPFRKKRWPGPKGKGCSSRGAAPAKARKGENPPSLKTSSSIMTAMPLRRKTFRGSRISAHGSTSNKSVKLTVEGHCDERGTQEYNLVLGQKRSEVVKEHLVKMGVDAKRINAVSYGKEAPADSGHTEDAWALNRRVHFNVD